MTGPDLKVIGLGPKFLERLKELVSELLHGSFLTHCSLQ